MALELLILLFFIYLWYVNAYVSSFYSFLLYNSRTPWSSILSPISNKVNPE